MLLKTITSKSIDYWCYLKNYLQINSLLMLLKILTPNQLIIDVIKKLPPNQLIIDVNK